MAVVAQRGKPRTVGFEHQCIDHLGRKIGRDTVLACDGNQFDARRGNRFEKIGIDPRRGESVAAAQRQRLVLRQVEFQLVVIHINLGHLRPVDGDVGRRKLLLTHLLDGQHSSRIAARNVHREAVDAAQVERLAFDKTQVARIVDFHDVARGRNVLAAELAAPGLLVEELEVER